MISEYILKNAKKGRARVAIGIIKTNAEIVDSLYRAQDFADVVVVGSEVSGFSCMPEKDNASQVLARLLLDKKVDAIVRGNLDAMEAMALISKEMGYKKILRTTCIRDLKGREFLLTPAAKKEGNSFTERLWMVAESAKFLKGLGVEPKVGVLALRDIKGLSDAFDQSIDEANYIVSKLRESDIKSDFAGYAPEVAVENYNIIVPPNGVIGNYIWRSIIGFGGGVDIGDFGLIPEIFVDDSKYWNDYFQPILFAVAMVNLRKV